MTTYRLLLTLFTLAGQAQPEAPTPGATPPSDPPAAPAPEDPAETPEPTPAAGEAASDTAVAPAGGVLRPEVKRSVPPRYPDLAKQEGWEGSCDLRLGVNEKGRVDKVAILSCPEVFVDSSVDAAVRWRFKPPVVNGEPVRTEFVLTLNYRLG